MEVQTSEPLFTSEGLADYLGVPLATIYVWRARGTAPRAYRVGRYTRYRKSEVDEWLDDRAESAAPAPRRAS
jgi:excisionase family DNA binding protein